LYQYVTEYSSARANLIWELYTANKLGIFLGSRRLNSVRESSEWIVRFLFEKSATEQTIRGQLPEHKKRPQVSARSIRRPINSEECICQGVAYQLYTTSNCWTPVQTPGAIYQMTRSVRLIPGGAVATRNIATIKTINDHQHGASTTIGNSTINELGDAFDGALSIRCIEVNTIERYMASHRRRPLRRTIVVCFLNGNLPEDAGLNKQFLCADAKSTTIFYCCLF
jgi:hypothetical protein